MSEMETNSHSQKPKTSKLAIASSSFALMSLFILPWDGVVYYPWNIYIDGPKIAGLPAALSLILGVTALFRIKKSKGLLKGIPLAVLGVVLAASISGIWILRGFGTRSSAYRMLCGTNLAHLGKAMLIYANDNSQYPDPNQWCDLLIKSRVASAKHFVCHPTIRIYSPFKLNWPAPKKGRSHYAINPNCQPDSPPNTVLLFETKIGWNQFGRQELLTTDNHNGEGCNILFNDARVRFEKIPAELNWSDKNEK